MLPLKAMCPHQQFVTALYSFKKHTAGSTQQLKICDFIQKVLVITIQHNADKIIHLSNPDVFL